MNEIFVDEDDQNKFADNFPRSAFGCFVTILITLALIGWGIYELLN